MRFTRLIVDPPWHFASRSEAGQGRSPSRHYPTLSIEDILALPIEPIAEKDAILFLWATAPHLETGLQALRAWGFTYSTNIVWVKMKRKKPQIGTGYRVRNSHEHLLIGTRGKMPAPHPSFRYSSSLLTLSPCAEEEEMDGSALLAIRGEHSRKPLDAYAYFRAYDGAAVEIFARPPESSLNYAVIEKWVLVGNEITGRDIRDDLSRLARAQTAKAFYPSNLPPFVWEG